MRRAAAAGNLSVIANQPPSFSRHFFLHQLFPTVAHLGENRAFSNSERQA